MKTFKIMLIIFLTNQIQNLVLLRSKKEFKIHQDRKLSNTVQMGKDFVNQLHQFYSKLDDMKKSLGFNKKSAFDKIDRALGKLDNAKPAMEEHEAEEEEEVVEEATDNVDRRRKLYSSKMFKK